MRHQHGHRIKGRVVSSDIALPLGIALKTLGQLNNVAHFEIGLIDLIASHITSNASFANNYNKYLKKTSPLLLLTTITHIDECESLLVGRTILTIQNYYEPLPCTGFRFWLARLLLLGSVILTTDSNPKLHLLVGTFISQSQTYDSNKLSARKF